MFARLYYSRQAPKTLRYFCGVNPPPSPRNENKPSTSEPPQFSAEREKYIALAVFAIYGLLYFNDVRLRIMLVKAEEDREKYKKIKKKIAELEKYIRKIRGN